MNIAPFFQHITQALLLHRQSPGDLDLINKKQKSAFISNGTFRKEK
jgi:hypothetical protein